MWWIVFIAAGLLIFEKAKYGTISSALGLIALGFFLVVAFILIACIIAPEPPAHAYFPTS